jgi:glycine cleavage system H protein
MDPTTLRFTRTHEWASLAQGVVTIGISKFAADQLNDITYIKLPDPGRQVHVDESFGEIETVKAVSDLYSPVRGEVTEVNKVVAADPEKIKDDPFGSGWLIKVKLASGASLDHLQSHADYENQIHSEPH